jgi:hypothetical protein
MISEWMKIMLEEISRKKSEAEQVRAEEQRRSDESRCVDAPGRGDEAGRSGEPAVPPRTGTHRARG